MINRGPDLLVRILVGALAGAVALSAGIAQNPGLARKAGEVENLSYAADALSVFIVVSLIGDRRLRVAIKRFASEEPSVLCGALRVFTKIRLLFPRGPTGMLRIRNRDLRN